jgi:transposase
VLPDRWVETVSAWFTNHPTVAIVSRDRSCEYATAIRKGARPALQVADRWHIGKNLADSVQTWLARGPAEIRRALHVQAVPEQEPGERELVPEEERRPARRRLVQLAREGRRAQKLDRYTQVVELHRASAESR